MQSPLEWVLRFRKDPQMALQDGELETWQEIAAYLGVSVREAQYREKNDQMPVHRLPGRKSRVWAYRAELEEWKARNGSAPANGSVGRRFLTRRALLLGGLAGGVLAAGSAALLLRGHSRPERAILSGNLLTALDGLGRTLWTHRFSGRLQQFSDVEMRWRVQVVDFKGDGYPSVVVACSFLAERLGRCVRPRRTLVFRSRWDQTMGTPLPTAAP